MIGVAADYAAVRVCRFLPSTAVHGTAANIMFGTSDCVNRREVCESVTVMKVLVIGAKSFL